MQCYLQTLSAFGYKEKVKALKLVLRTYVV